MTIGDFIILVALMVAIVGLILSFATLAFPGVVMLKTVSAFMMSGGAIVYMVALFLEF